MKKLIIDKGVFFQRVALLKEGTIEYIDYKLDESLSVGDIYLAKVKTINQANKSAFLELSENREAYLGECIPELKQGELIIVEVIKEAFGGKLPSVTRDISIAGQNLIFLPKGKGLKYSRKLKSDEIIKNLIKSLEPLITQGGVILRSGADFQNGSLIMEELVHLIEEYNDYDKSSKIANKPKLIKKALESYEELLSSKREVYEIIVNDKNLYKKLKSSIYLKERDAIYLKETSLFSVYGISEDKILGNKYNVDGCELVIENTEAMTIIDVNSKGKEMSIQREQNILEINLSLCERIVQLIIMKNISGIIIVDFISMKTISSNKALLEKLKFEFRVDRNAVKIMEITSLGLVQIVRTRKEKPILENLTSPCSHCEGKGYEANNNLEKIRIEERIQLLGYEQMLNVIDDIGKYFTKGEIELLEKNYK